MYVATCMPVTPGLRVEIGQTQDFWGLLASSLALGSVRATMSEEEW